MFSRVSCLALPMSFWYLQRKISHSMCYQVLDYFHFMLYRNFTVYVEKVFISSKILFFFVFLIELSDSPLNVSPEKLYHTIWFIISKIDIFCWEWENNRYGTLNAVLTIFAKNFHRRCSTGFYIRLLRFWYLNISLIKWLETKCRCITGKVIHILMKSCS